MFAVLKESKKWQVNTGKSPRKSILAARVYAQVLQGEEPRHFVVAVCRAKEHNPSRKLLEYHRWHSRQSD